MQVSGGGVIDAPCVNVGGNFQNGGTISLSKCSSVTTGAAPTADPYASVPQPTASGSCLTVPGSNTVTLSPGNYCSGMNINGNQTVTMQPGVYYVNGNFQISGGSGSTTGSGVTIFIKANGNMNISGGATMSFTAPTSGTYSGIVFFGDRSGSNINYQLAGGSNTSITGAMYFPTGNLQFAGGANFSNNCLQIVAYKLQVSGGTNFSYTSCTGAGLQQIAVNEGTSSGSRKLAE